MTTPMPFYDRAPSQELQDLLLPGGFLAPLVELAGRQVSGHRHAVYLRVKNEVDVYRGRTVLVNAKRLFNGRVRIKAHSAYDSQPGAKDFLREWQADETGFADALNHYLSEVKVTRQDLTRGEAKVQEQWSLVREPWIPFDREGRLRGDHKMGADFPAIREANSKLDAPTRSSGSRKAEKIDQLAIDPQGRLVLLELKDTSKKDTSKNDSEIYYSPFQLLQYVWEWHDVLESVRNDLQAVIDARVAVGLTPACIPRLTGGIRAAVGFGADQRSPGVKRRYAMVLDIVNQHLPDDVDPIETWAFADTGPKLVT